MPYISRKDRNRVGKTDMIPLTAGELNYVFTKYINQYVNHKGLSYQIINDVVGAIEGAKAEFQRRVVGPYEDKKIADCHNHGEVYNGKCIIDTDRE